MVKRINLSSFISSIKKTFSPKNMQETKPMKFIEGKDEFVPNFIQKDYDTLGITVSDVKFFPEDIEVMEKITDAKELLKYKSNLMKQKKYIKE